MPWRIRTHLRWFWRFWGIYPWLNIDDWLHLNCELGADCQRRQALQEAASSNIWHKLTFGDRKSALFPDVTSIGIV